MEGREKTQIMKQPWLILNVFAFPLKCSPESERNEIEQFNHEDFVDLSATGVWSVSP